MSLVPTPPPRRARSRALALLCVAALAAGALWSGWHGDDTPESWRTVLSDVDDDGQGESVGRLVRAAQNRRDADRDERFVDGPAKRARTAPGAPPAILAAAAVLHLSSAALAAHLLPAAPTLARSIHTSSRAPPALLFRAV